MRFVLLDKSGTRARLKKCSRFGLKTNFRFAPQERGAHPAVVVHLAREHVALLQDVLRNR